MTLDQASERDYRESEIVALARLMFPHVSEELIRGIFVAGYAMGSLYGMAEAAATAEKALIDSMRTGNAVH